MSKAKVILATAIAVIAALAAATFLPLPPDDPASEKSSDRSSPKAAAGVPPPKTLPAQPPDLRALAGRLGAGTLPPTPAQIEEERRVEREQVAEAVRSLRSTDAEERVGAVQQLAAYPTREAQRRLVAALTGDAAAAVREAAALSLAYVNAAESWTIEALLGALRDASSEVRAAALQTLEGYLNGLDPESTRFRRIRKGLAGLLKSHKLDVETRRGVRELLADTED